MPSPLHDLCGRLGVKLVHATAYPGAVYGTNLQRRPTKVVAEDVRYYMPPRSQNWAGTRIYIHWLPGRPQTKLELAVFALRLTYTDADIVVVKMSPKWEKRHGQEKTTQDN